MTHHTIEEIRSWLSDPSQWPNDSYDIDSLQPSSVQENRDKLLMPYLPAWFWDGEEGQSILTIGSGKGYYERRYWGNFERVFVVDPSDKTRLSFHYFPARNVSYLGPTLFKVSPYVELTPKYGWLGACIHYLFGEFHGWEFMRKLAMIVSDTLIVDAGIFEPDTRHGSVMLDSWQGDEIFEMYRRGQFSFDSFRKAIEGLWEVKWAAPTPWIDGRTSLILKRVLPPSIQKSDLGEMELVKRTDYSTVYRTSDGYYKEAPQVSRLLVYDTVSKVMGWDGLVQRKVYDGDRYVGFTTRDCGKEMPSDSAASEELFLGLSSWLLPLGLIPADVARQNVRVCDGRPVWIDIDLRDLQDLDARMALWVITNIYKQYGNVPDYIRSVSGHLRAAGRSARPAASA